MRRVLVALLSLGALAAPAAAEELKTTINPTLFLGITAPRPVDRAAAYQQALRDSGPPPPPNPFAGEVQDDGSVKYGSVTVTVRNPCPPGTAHYEAPLPGRRSK